MVSSKRLYILLVALSICIIDNQAANGQIVEAAPTPSSPPTKAIPGGIVKTSYEDGVVKRFDELLDSALNNDPASIKLSEAVSHYRKAKQKVTARAKDALNTVVPYSGFSHSSELADLISDDKVKLKSRSAAEFARQKHIDAKHLELTSSLMEIAAAVGDPSGLSQKRFSLQLSAQKPAADSAAKPAANPTAETTIEAAPIATKETETTAATKELLKAAAPEQSERTAAGSKKSSRIRTRQAAAPAADPPSSLTAPSPFAAALPSKEIRTANNKSLPAEPLEELNRLLAADTESNTTIATNASTDSSVISNKAADTSSQSESTTTETAAPESTVTVSDDSQPDALRQLANLVGEKKAQDTLEFLKQWEAEVSIPNEVFAEPTWSPRQQQTKFQIAYEAALQQDAVIKQVREHLNKYNHIGVAKRATGHILETVLGVASFAPNLAGPVAQVGLVAFEQSTGGSEESKVMKELYLSKRLESRAHVLSEEAHLALMNYQLGLVNHNKLQLLYGELLINDLCGVDACNKIFARPVVTGVLRRQFSSLRPHDQHIADMPEQGKLE